MTPDELGRNILIKGNYSRTNAVPNGSKCHTSKLRDYLTKLKLWKQDIMRKVASQCICY